VVVSGLSNAVALNTAYSHTCAVKADGTVACWGFNNAGQLGDGTIVNKGVPTAVPGLTNVAAVAASASHSCALKDDGSAVCWGGNGSGQLGDGTMVDRGAATAVLGGAVYWK